jgi:hypothetical protein
MFPKHGKIDCKVCFDNKENVTKPHCDWKMINDPGAWGGGENPEYLVLGFSKGATQANYYANGSFEKVAFKGMRPRLTQALRAIGVLSTSETVDDKIENPNSNIAFGSLIRCSVSRLDKKATEKKGIEVYSCTGPLIKKSFKEIPNILTQCTENFISDLPRSIKIVFLLGNDSGYVKSCQNLLKNKFSVDYVVINAMTVRADNRVWIHIAHPSGLNGHFGKWLVGDEGSGIKRKEAIEGVLKAT